MPYGGKISGAILFNDQIRHIRTNNYTVEPLSTTTRKCIPINSQLNNSENEEHIFFTFSLLLRHVILPHINGYLGSKV